MSPHRQDDSDWDVTSTPRSPSRRRRSATETGQGWLFEEAAMQPAAPGPAAVGPPQSPPAPEPAPGTPAASVLTSETQMAAKKTPKRSDRPGRRPRAASKAAPGAGGRRRSAAAPKGGEASVSVRQRAYRQEEASEEREISIDEELPPGVSPRGGGGRAGRGPMRRKRGPPKGDPTVKAIDRTARSVYGRILKRQKPELKSPVRALSNVRYQEKVGYFEIGRQTKVRTLTVNTVRTFAQSLRMMSLSKDMVKEDTFATKRDAYYQSKNWGDARFDEQSESDAVMDDIEAMFSMEGVSREQLRFYPEEHGGAVAGELVVIDRDPVTGGRIEIDCTRFGSGAYTIPHSVEHLEFRTKASFVLAIETGGMFQRLQYHAYPHRAKCIIVSMGGVPTRACRRFIRRLSEATRIPVYAFVDCDPYGISNIYRSLKVGSGNAAHINRFFCVPQARFLGVTPQDIIDYKLPTHPLKDVDVARARDALKNDPFFKVHRPWTRAMEQLLKMGVRAEQQALAKWGLNYVMDVYLPAKMKERKSFLP